jgi:hypothetical protein
VLLEPMLRWVWCITCRCDLVEGGIFNPFDINIEPM